MTAVSGISNNKILFCKSAELQFESEKKEIEELIIPEYLERIIEKKVQNSVLDVTERVIEKKITKIYLSIIEKIVHFILMEFSCFYPKYKKIYRWHLENPNAVQFHYKKDWNNRSKRIYPSDFPHHRFSCATLEVVRLENKLITLEEAKQNLKKLLPNEYYEKWCADLAQRISKGMIRCS